MEDNQKQEEVASQTVINKLQKTVPSEFLDSYLRFFGISRETFFDLQAQTLASLQKFVIIAAEKPFRSKILVKLITHSARFEFFQVEVSLGSFIFPHISVMNINSYSASHSLHYRRLGTFGTVYRGYCYEEEIAIKCFQFSKSNFAEVLAETLSEYCLMKLASHLKVGPQLHERMGYEVVVYRDCIEFAMEYCEEISFHYQPKEEELHQLKASLLQMHQARLVHLDIKHENLCYSSTHKRLIFVDFGLSKILQEDLGFKTLTHFVGTIQYCGEEMTNLSKVIEKSWVDLYYNDINCLSTTFPESTKDASHQDFEEQKAARRAIFHKIETITLFHLKHLIKFQPFLR